MANWASFLKHRRCSIETARQKGAAAVEFALTLPLWITLLLGMSDGAYCMLVNEKCDRIAYSVTDIVTQYQSVSLSNLSDIIQAASQLMQPFVFANNGIVIVTSVYQPSGSSPRICWQYTGGGSLTGHVSKIGTPNGSSTCSQGSVAALPNGLTLNNNDNVIISEVYYSFTPMFISTNLFPANLIYKVAVYKPRLSPLITTPS